MSNSTTSTNTPNVRLTISSWIAYFSFRALLRLTSWLPLSVSRSIGRALGMGYYHVFNKRVHIARVNMGICFPDLSATEREERVKQSLAHAGMWFMEAGAIWLWPREKILRHVTVANPEILEQALEQQHGVILAVPHFGNWEIMGPIITRDHDFTCFYQIDDNSVQIDNFIVRQRSRHGVLLAPANSLGIRRLYKQLKEGKIAGILPDHIPTQEMGVFAPFYSRPALTGTLISSLAKKNGALVLTATVMRTATGFEVRYGPVADQYSDDPVVAATGINRAIENAISIAPEQFQWVYPRFKKRPNPTQEQSPYR